MLLYKLNTLTVVNMRKWVLLMLVAWVGISQAQELDNRAVQIKLNQQICTVELVYDNAARSRGLSLRKSLAENHGMLFVFPDSRPRTFWMKDTYIPLSIAYLDESSSVISILDMEPLNETILYRSYFPARYALEMSQGWFASHNVKTGDRIEFTLPKDIRVE